MGVDVERKTWYADPERVSRDEILQLNHSLMDNPLLKAIFSYAPFFVGVLNRYRQFVLLNEDYFAGMGLREAGHALSMRPGEVFGCLHSEEMPAGCGTGVSCRYCTAVNTVLDALSSGERVSRDTRLMTRTPEGLRGWDLHITAQPTVIEGETLVILFMHDVSTMKRKEMIERIFFHDVLNSANTLGSLGQFIDEELLPDDEFREYLPLYTSTLRDIVEQIQYYRRLTRAESGELELKVEHFRLDREIEELISGFRIRSGMNGQTVRIETDLPETVIASDRVLVRRIVLNMLKNAVEAGSRDRTVTVSLRTGREDGILVEVHNPEFIPAEVSSQIFQHSFSTKGRGRGLGTYSMKLLSTRYLGGDVHLSSGEETGTAFILELPKEVLS